MKKFLKKFGFTLVELMIVISIIWILSATLYPQITGYFERTQNIKRRQEVQKVSLGIETYYADYGSYKIPNTGLKWQWYWWFNVSNDWYPWNYTKSTSQWLEELWYIRPWTIPTIKLQKNWREIKVYNNSPCSEDSNFALMFYFDDSLWKYAIFTTVTNPTTKEIEEVTNLYKALDEFGPCTRYGKNYGIWN